AFRALGNIYWLFSSDLFRHSSTPDLSKLILPCQPDIQEKIEEFVLEEIDNYRNIYYEAEAKIIEERKNKEIEERNQGIDENIQDSERPIKKPTKNVDVIINPEEKYHIMEVIGTLLRGVRGGWFHVSHAVSVLCQFGTLGGDLDEVIKKLIHEFKEQILSGEAKQFATVFISSLKKSHSLYASGRVGSMNGTSSLARLCSHALQSRDTREKSSLRDAEHIVELHKEGISYITSKILEYQRTNNTEAVPRMIKFFKILGMLLTGVGSSDAHKIESILKEELESRKIDVIESEKQWEPYYSYLLRVSNAATKGVSKKGNNAKSSLKKKRRPSDPKRNSRDHHVDSNSENQENNEELVTPSLGKSRNGNVAPPSFGDEEANNSLNNNEMPSSIKRSAPVDDDAEVTKSPPKKRRSSTKRKPSHEEIINNEGILDNDESDRESAESFQSVSDIRNKKR
ncbi:11005_t:CDS:2, partial [Acaulospora morrowiae]